MDSGIQRVVHRLCSIVAVGIAAIACAADGAVQRPETYFFFFGCNFSVKGLPPGPEAVTTAGPGAAML